MFGWLFRSNDNDDSAADSKPHELIPYLRNSDGIRDEYNVMLDCNARGPDARDIPLPDGARGTIHRNGRVAADWKRADGSYSKFAKDSDARDEAMNRLQQARKWWFSS